MQSLCKHYYLIACLWASLSGLAVSQVPQLINYQGLLADPATGQPVADDTYEIVFSIYDTPTGGSAVWAETQNATTSDGLYSVLLGSITPLTPAILTGPEKYLGIKVGADPEMAPRKRLMSVAYAILSGNADSLGGKGAVEYATKTELSTSDGDPPNQGSNQVSWDNLKDMPPGFADGVDNANGGGGNTLDQAYDQGGAGAGRTITADAGAVNIAGPDGLTVDGNVGINNSLTLATDAPVRLETGGVQELSRIYGTSLGSFGYVVNGWNIAGSPNTIPLTQMEPSHQTAWSYLYESFSGGNPSYIGWGVGFTDAGAGVRRTPFATYLWEGSKELVTHIQGDHIYIQDGSQISLGKIWRDASTTYWQIRQQNALGEPTIFATLSLDNSGLLAIDPQSHTSFSGNVGIGTATPAELLDVNGTIQMTGLRLTTAPSDGYVLTSDAGGFGTWQPVSGGFALPFSGSASSTETAFAITNNGDGAAIIGNTSGMGDAGGFGIFNANNDRPTVNAFTQGLGPAGQFEIQNAGNSDAALIGITSGTGQAGRFEINNSVSNAFALSARTNGTGYAGDFRIFNPSNDSPSLHGFTDGSGAAVFGNNSGTGEAGGFGIFNANNDRPAVNAFTQGLGPAGQFDIQNAGNSDAALIGMTNGTGHAGRFEINNSVSNAFALSASTNGTGYAGDFRIFNPSNDSPSLHGFTDGSGAAVFGNNSGTGETGGFGIFNANNVRPTVNAFTQGLGPAGQFEIQNASNSDAALIGITNGTGHAGRFENTNPSNENAALSSFTNGSGSSLFCSHTGTGAGGFFEIDNFANSQPAMVATTNGAGAAVAGNTSGSGSGGDFRISNSSNFEAALFSMTEGAGTALLANHAGASGDIATFQSNGSNEARIDKTGKGFFNGGTQTGGADVAEAFEVEGMVQEYEPGDVLVISTDSDRSVAKCANAYSTLVIGVYATKPGVLLSERSIDDNHDDTIPVGIIGVIPTKVSGENGPIRRGDLLVTSSTPGHAMKGTRRDIMLGSTIGKALEDFSSSGTGVIRVLVTLQ